MSNIINKSKQKNFEIRKFELMHCLSDETFREKERLLIWPWWKSLFIPKSAYLATYMYEYGLCVYRSQSHITVT